MALVLSQERGEAITIDLPNGKQIIVARGWIVGEMSR
jgi:hypothetical protein